MWGKTLTQKQAPEIICSFATDETNLYAAGQTDGSLIFWRPRSYQKILQIEKFGHTTTQSVDLSASKPNLLLDKPRKNDVTVEKSKCTKAKKFFWKTFCVYFCFFLVV